MFQLHLLFKQMFQYIHLLTTLITNKLTIKLSIQSIAVESPVTDRRQ